MGSKRGREGGVLSGQRERGGREGWRGAECAAREGREGGVMSGQRERGGREGGRVLSVQ